MNNSRCKAQPPLKGRFFTPKRRLSVAVLAAAGLLSPLASAATQSGAAGFPLNVHSEWFSEKPFEQHSERHYKLPDGMSMDEYFRRFFKQDAPSWWQHGNEEKWRLGVQIQPVSPEVAASLDLEEAKGALVARVMPKSPAAQAGVEVGDVILGLDGKAVAGPDDLVNMIKEMAKGSAALRIWRNGTEQTLTTQFETADDEKMVKLESEPKGKLGVKIATLTDEARSHYEVADGASGVVIVDVQSDSPAFKHGLRAGDIIERIGPTEVSEPQQVIDAVEKASAEQRPLLVLIDRQGAKQFFALKIT